MRNIHKVRVIGFATLLVGLIVMLAAFAANVGTVTAQTTTTAAVTTAATTTAAVTTTAVTTAAVTTAGTTTAATTTIAVTTVAGVTASPTIGGQGGVGAPATGLGTADTGADNMGPLAAIVLLILTLVVSGGFLMARARNRRV